MENEELDYVQAAQCCQSRGIAQLTTAKVDMETHERRVQALPSAEIFSINFSTYTSREHMAMAAVVIRTPVDRANSATPFSVLSPSMGPTRPEEGPCVTCCRSAPQCDGHFGCIVFPVPLYNPLSIGTICTVLNLFCHACGAITFDPLPDMQPILQGLEPGPARWERLANFTGRGYCNHAGCEVQLEKFYLVQHKTSPFMIKHGKVLFSEHEALRMLRRIRLEDVQLYIGLPDVERMVSRFMLESILVPPNRSRDALITKAYNTIVKDICAMAKYMGDTFDSKWGRLGCMNDLYNDVAQLNSGHGRQYAGLNTHGLSQRKFNGKESLTRAEMIRPRTVNAGYSTMNPNAIYPDVFGIPTIFQSKLNVTERACYVNIERLRELKRQNKLTCIETMNARTGAFQKVKDIQAYDLCMGDRVSRHIDNDDHVIPIRTPTFSHKAVNGARVKTHKNLVFTYYTATYADALRGDFDGDAVVAHVVDGVHANAEVCAINTTRNNFESRTSGIASGGPHFNAPLACYYLSIVDTVELGVIEACFALLEGQPQMESLELRLMALDVPLNSGRAIFSACLPARLACDAAGGVVIRLGCLVRGRLSADSVREGHACILKFIIEQYGPQHAERYVHNVTIVTNIYLSMCPVSMGFNDIIEYHVDGKELTMDYVKRVHDLHEIEADPARLEEAIATETVNFTNVLAQRIRDGGRKGVVTDYSEAKASKMAQNRIYISGCLGQQYIDGSRFEISRAFGNPDAWKLDPQNRGFICQNLVDGMSPVGVFSHAQSSRKSLTDQNQSNEPGKTVLHIAAAVNNIKTTETRSVITLDGARFVELLFGGSGLDTRHAWIRFPGKSSATRTFLDLASFSERLLQESTIGTPEDDCHIAANEFVQAAHAKATRFDLSDFMHGVYAAPTYILNRFEDVQQHVICGDLDVFELALETLGKPTHGEMSFGEGGSVLLPSWLYDALVAPVARDNDFRHLEFYRCKPAQLAFAMWHWRSIYAAVRPRLPVDHALDFQALLVELAEWLESDDGAAFDAARFAGLFRRDVPPAIVSMDVFTQRHNYHVLDFEKNYTKALDTVWRRMPMNADHTSMVRKVAWREACRQIPTLSLMARLWMCPLVHVVELAQRLFFTNLRKKSLDFLYSVLEAKPFSSTVVGKERAVLLRWLEPSRRPRETFVAQMNFLLMNLPESNAPKPKGIISLQPFYDAVTQTDYFMHVHWELGKQLAEMGSQVVASILSLIFADDIPVMLCKPLVMARVFSQFWTDLHKQHLRTPLNSYTVRGGLPLVLARGGSSVARQMGEHLVFQHYMFVCLWLMTRSLGKRDAINAANEAYWNLEMQVPNRKRASNVL